MPLTADQAGQGQTRPSAARAPLNKDGALVPPTQGAAPQLYFACDSGRLREPFGAAAEGMATGAGCGRQRGGWKRPLLMRLKTPLGDVSLLMRDTDRHSSRRELLVIMFGITRCSTEGGSLTVLGYISDC